MKNIPERIWLNLGEGVDRDDDFREYSHVTWSEEKIFDDDIEYVRKTEWVSVEERLPEPMQRVLVWIGDEALVCWYTKSGRFKTTLRSKERYSENKSLHERIHLSPCREDVTDIATHWLPIPPLNPGKEER